MLQRSVSTCSTDENSKYFLPDDLIAVVAEDRSPDKKHEDGLSNDSGASVQHSRNHLGANGARLDTAVLPPFQLQEGAGLGPSLPYQNGGSHVNQGGLPSLDDEGIFSTTRRHTTEGMGLFEQAVSLGAAEPSAYESAGLDASQNASLESDLRSTAKTYEPKNHGWDLGIGFGPANGVPSAHSQVGMTSPSPDPHLVLPPSNSHSLFLEGQDPFFDLSDTTSFSPPSKSPGGYFTDSFQSARNLLTGALLGKRTSSKDDFFRIQVGGVPDSSPAEKTEAMTNTETGAETLTKPEPRPVPEKVPIQPEILPSSWGSVVSKAPVSSPRHMLSPEPSRLSQRWPKSTTNKRDDAKTVSPMRPVKTSSTRTLEGAKPTNVSNRNSGLRRQNTASPRHGTGGSFQQHQQQQPLRSKSSQPARLHQQNSRHHQGSVARKPEGSKPLFTQESKAPKSHGSGSKTRKRTPRATADGFFKVTNNHGETKLPSSEASHRHKPKQTERPAMRNAWNVLNNDDDDNDNDNESSESTATSESGSQSASSQKVAHSKNAYKREEKEKKANFDKHAKVNSSAKERFADVAKTESSKGTPVTSDKQVLHGKHDLKPKESDLASSISIKTTSHDSLQKSDATPVEHALPSQPELPAAQSSDVARTRAASDVKPSVHRTIDRLLPSISPSGSKKNKKQQADSKHEHGPEKPSSSSSNRSNSRRQSKKDEEARSASGVALSSHRANGAEEAGAETIQDSADGAQVKACGEELQEQLSEQVGTLSASLSGHREHMQVRVKNAGQSLLKSFENVVSSGVSISKSGGKALVQLHFDARYGLSETEALASYTFLELFYPLYTYVLVHLPATVHTFLWYGFLWQMLCTKACPKAYIYRVLVLLLFFIQGGSSLPIALYFGEPRLLLVSYILLLLRRDVSFLRLKVLLLVSAHIVFSLLMDNIFIEYFIILAEVASLHEFSLEQEAEADL